MTPRLGIRSANRVRDLLKTILTKIGGKKVKYMAKINDVVLFMLHNFCAFVFELPLILDNVRVAKSSDTLLCQN